MRALRIMLNSIAMVDVDSDLSALREAVGGEIETVGLRDGGVMIVNRDGMQQQYPHNDTASCIKRASHLRNGADRRRGRRRF